MDKPHPTDRVAYQKSREAHPTDTVAHQKSPELLPESPEAHQKSPESFQNSPEAQLFLLLSIMSLQKSRVGEVNW